MAEKRTNDLEKLQQAFARPERIHDGAMLAGSALVTPLLAVRQRQARMEAARATARRGAAHPETRARQAEAAALAERAGHLAADIGRQRLIKPQVGDQAGLYGRVTRDGAGVPGVAVLALDAQGEALVHSCTGREGDYALSFAPDRPVAIEVRDAAQPLWRDGKGRSYPAYRATHRDIELSKAKPRCPEAEPKEPPAYTPNVQVPNLVTMPVDEAIRSIRALGLEPGKRKAQTSDRPDMVLQQNPVAGTRVAAGAAIDLVVSIADDRPVARVGDLQGKSLARAIGEIEVAGAALGAVNIASGGGRTALVEAAKPDDKGGAIDLHITSSGGDAQLTQVVAAVLATTSEAAELALVGKAAAADWLKRHKLTNLDKIGEALAMEDGALRKRLKLQKDHPVRAVRGVLQAAVSRVRKV